MHEESLRRLSAGGVKSERNSCGKGAMFEIVSVVRFERFLNVNFMQLGKRL